MINIDRSLDIFKMTSDSSRHIIPLGNTISQITYCGWCLVFSVYVKDYINRYLSNHLQAELAEGQPMTSHGSVDDPVFPWSQLSKSTPNYYLSHQGCKDPS